MIREFYDRAQRHTVETSRTTDLATEITEQWGDDPAAAICLRIIEHIENSLEETPGKLTLGRIASVAGCSHTSDVLQHALAILVSSKIHALDSFAVFVEDGSSYEIDENTLELAR